MPLADVGAVDSPFEARRSASTLPADLAKLATAILDDPPDAATFIAHAITGGNKGLGAPAISRVVRMNPLISPSAYIDGAWTAPAKMSVAAFQYLCSIGMDALMPFEITYIDNYCMAWLEDYAPNQAIRANGKRFDP